MKIFKSKMNCLKYLAFSLSVLFVVDARPNCDCSPNLTDRIINGEKAAEHEFPWQLSLGLTRYGAVSHICGASLLNENWVVTAGHCVSGYKNEKDYMIGYGSSDLREMRYDRIPAKRIIIHPQYDESTPSSHGDIALIELSRPINITQNVRPACLMADVKQLNKILANEQDTKLTATGFGSYKRTYKWLMGPLRGGKTSQDLKKADFYAVQPNDRNNDCRQRDDLICIKPITKGDSICNGDSGGPLQFVMQGSDNDTSPGDTPNKMVVVGVTSFGSGDMSLIGYITFCNGYGAYTKIPYFNDFITRSIDTNDLCLV